MSNALTALLNRYDIRVQTFSDAADFISAWSSEHMTHGCLLIDVERTGETGWLLVRHLRDEGFTLPVVIISDVCDRALRGRAEQVGATDVIERQLIDTFVGQRLLEFVDGPFRPAVESATRLRDGTPATFRVMRPEDAEIEQAFVRSLSISSRHLRFFSGLNELPPALLHTFTHPDFPASYALIATIEDTGAEQIVGVARYNACDAVGVAEFAIVVADAWQGFGIGGRLLRGLTAVAAIAGFELLEGFVLKENRPMLRLARALGFTRAGATDDPTIVRVIKTLRLEHPVPTTHP